jgi:hypothetical protein
MLTKIISGGQIGAEQAALDTAMKLGISHGGWIQKGRRTQSWTLPEKYQLQEMTTSSHKKRIEQNVIDSDGTLIISNGRLSGASDYSRQMALDHQRPLLHVDLTQLNIGQAAKLIHSWIELHHIDVLNVSGPLSSEDARIYTLTLEVLENACVSGPAEAETLSLGSLQGQPVSPTYSSDSVSPKTLDQAVIRLMKEMPLRDKTTMAKLTKDELGPLNLSLGTYIIDHLFQKDKNTKLLKSCCDASGNIHMIPSSAAFLIIEKLWEKLQQTHRLRVVK